MKTITRGELGNILSASMPTRTLHRNESDIGRDVTDAWIVTYLETNESGILLIFCEPPESA